MNLHKITQRYLELFPGDTSYNPYQRPTPDVLFALVNPEEFSNARLLHFNQKLSEEIGLGEVEQSEDEGFLNATEIPSYLKPYATAYAGYQFGQWAGQLGDGRAIFSGEITADNGKTYELQWKGAGATPYSRHADGRAVLRSTIREYLMSEALHHLGIPTTRALSLSLTGESVVRDIQYSGNPKPEQGALMLRVAESFLRFGHFEFLSSTKNYDTLRQLLDFTIENYFQDIKPDDERKYLHWFQLVTRRTADLVVDWYRVGFTHGVMNTDNMSVLGLTIDFGPFSMLDEYDLNFTSNTTDLPMRRYAFGNQAKIAQWNLWNLSNAIFPLIQEEQPLEDILNDFESYFWQKHDEMLCRKFGFDSLLKNDDLFFNRWQNLMQNLKIDYTLFFSKLEVCPEGLGTYYPYFSEVFYGDLSEEEIGSFDDFVKKYFERLSYNKISKEDSVKLMKANNPKFILRNYLLFEAIEGMERENDELFRHLFHALQNPYEELYPEFSVKRPSKYNGVWGCTSLSCSS